MSESVSTLTLVGQMVSSMVTVQTAVIAVGGVGLYLAYTAMAARKVFEVVTEKREVKDASGKVVGYTTHRYRREMARPDKLPKVPGVPRRFRVKEEGKFYDSIMGKYKSAKDYLSGETERSARRAAIDDVMERYGKRRPKWAVGDNRDEWGEDTDYSKAPQTKRGDADDFWTNRPKWNQPGGEGRRRRSKWEDD